jgi:hypothetical protein
MTAEHTTPRNQWGSRGCSVVDLFIPISPNSQQRSPFDRPAFVKGQILRTEATSETQTFERRFLEVSSRASALFIHEFTANHVISQVPSVVADVLASNSSRAEANTFASAIFHQ